MCFTSLFFKVEYIMLTWIIQISIISIIFIFLVHHLLMFLKTTLTVPKIKDLVNSPNQKYQNIYDTISHKSNTNSNSYTDIDLLPSEVIPNMKDELKSFLKKQLNNDSSNDNSRNDNSNGSRNDNNVMGLDSLTGGNFSNY
jgi:hypothetical protein